jgi:hypothetical protein
MLLSTLHYVDNLYLTVSVVGTSYIFKTMRWRGGGESLPFTVQTINDTLAVIPPGASTYDREHEGSLWSSVCRTSVCVVLGQDSELCARMLVHTCLSAQYR